MSLSTFWPHLPPRIQYSTVLYCTYLNVSFGWSAGDIAQAISLIVKIVKALDGVDGAASDYREAVIFLSSLQRTLEALRTLSVLEYSPAHKDDIEHAVRKIKDPINKFLALTSKFEPTLGTASHSTHYQHVGKKLQWRFMASKKADELKKSIETNLGILNSLLHRLTMQVYSYCLV